MWCLSSDNLCKFGSRSLMLESRTRNPKVAGSSLRSGNCRWGEWMYSAFNTTTEVLLSKAPNPQLLPGRRSINGCPLLRVCVHGVCVFTAVCVHFGWDKCRAQIPSMGYHTWPHVTSLHFTTSTDLNMVYSCSSVHVILHSGANSVRNWPPCRINYIYW